MCPSFCPNGLELLFLLAIAFGLGILSGALGIAAVSVPATALSVLGRAGQKPCRTCGK